VNIAPKYLFIALFSGLLVLSGCSKQEEEEAKQDNPAASTQAQPSTSTALPSNHPTMPQQAPAASQGPVGQGKVLKAMHASGYTYMEVDTGDKTVWLAATSLKIKAGDTVQWQGASVMKNFNSKTLRRTFDEILFVSKASAVK
jgi:outer membrane murein-binding lipoprotein Lpp